MVATNNSFNNIDAARTEISGATLLVSFGSAVATVLFVDIHWLWSIPVFFAMSVLYPTAARLSSRVLLSSARWAQADEPKASEIAVWPVTVPIRLVYYFISGIVARLFPDADAT